MTDPRTSMRWVVRGIALAVLAIGWTFIAWQNHFRLSAPVVIVGLGYLAVIATIYNLWRTGVSAVAADEDGADSTWAKPVGELGELEREKRTLLKAIKEAEFDREMGKLSQHDAEQMIASYRARAIEVIKHIDRHALGAAGTPREQIQREVRARLALDARAPAREAGDAKGKGKGKAKAAAAEPAATPVTTGEATASGAAEAPAATDAASADAASAEAAAPRDRAAEASPSDASEASRESSESSDGPAREAGGAESSPASAHGDRDDADVLDADSTTAIEPRREVSAKAATP